MPFLLLLFYFFATYSGQLSEYFLAFSTFLLKCDKKTNYVQRELSWFQLGRSWFSSKCLVQLGFGKKKQCWLHTDVSVVAEQRCTETRMFQFSVSHSALPAMGLGGHKNLGGDRTRTADLNWPKGYPIPHGTVWTNYKTSWLGSLLLFGVWLDIGQWVVSRSAVALCIHCFVSVCVHIYICECVYIYLLLFLLFLSL